MKIKYFFLVISLDFLQKEYFLKNWKNSFYTFFFLIIRSIENFYFIPIHKIILYIIIYLFIFINLKKNIT